MKLTRRGLFRTAGAVIVAPALEIVHAIEKDKRTGTVWIAFWVTSGAKRNDEMELIIASEGEPGPWSRWYRDRQRIHYRAEPMASSVTFELTGPIIEGIRRRGRNQYQVNLYRKDGKEMMIYTTAEGHMSATEGGYIIMDGKGAIPDLPRDIRYL